MCVITYNHGEWLRECLQSIVDQVTDFDYEVIVGDDCSTDGTQAILRVFAERYPNIIRPIYQQKNSGGSQNYLDVHAAARGKYVAHIDGDDLMYPGKIAKQVAEFDRDPLLCVCWHRMERFDKSGVRIKYYWADALEYPKGEVTLERALRFGSPGAHSALMYKRSCWPSDLPDGDIMDLIISWRILESGRGLIIREVLGGYRIGFGISSKRRLQIRGLNCRYSREYLDRLPQYKKSIFLFSLSGAIYDFLKRNDSWRCFAGNCIKIFKIRYLIYIPSQLYVLSHAYFANKKIRNKTDVKSLLFGRF